MTKFVTFKLPDGKYAKLLFTRYSEDDNWFCQMSDESMDELQDILGKDFNYGFI